MSFLLDYTSLIFLLYMDFQETVSAMRHQKIAYPWSFLKASPERPVVDHVVILPVSVEKPSTVLPKNVRTVTKYMVQTTKLLNGLFFSICFQSMEYAIGCEIFKNILLWA